MEALLVQLIAFCLGFLVNKLSDRYDWRSWPVLLIFWLILEGFLLQVYLTQEHPADWVPWAAAGVAIIFAIHLAFAIGRSSRDRAAQSQQTPRDILLLQVGNEVQQRLSKSLHRIATQPLYLKPDAEEDPNQVEDPWECDVKVGEQPVVRLQQADIAALYDRQDIQGRLLILGDPGTGKTTVLLKLAEVLVARARETEPVPVLFNLSAWKQDSQSIEQWLVAELKRKYGVRAELGERWLRSGEIIPLLDGLDELASQRQEPCVERLNQFLQPGSWTGALIVCSRTKEHQLYATRLRLNNSLILQPWGEAKIKEYALRVVDGPQLWQIIAADPLLLRGQGKDGNSVGLARGVPHGDVPVAQELRRNSSKLFKW